MSVLFSIALFVFFGVAFVFANLAMGSLIRPRLPDAQKLTAYECGEPTIGSSWVQFDLRFYIIALVFLIFDVEVALFYPWAVVYGDAGAVAAGTPSGAFALRQTTLVEMLIFFGVLVVGYAYLWKFGYLDWVRSAATTSLASAPPEMPSVQTGSPAISPSRPS